MNKQRERRILIAILPFIGLFGNVSIGSNIADPPPEKPCLRCGKIKQHNNSFCSPECCREYRDLKKAEK